VTISGKPCPILFINETVISCRLPSAGNPFWAADVSLVAFGETTIGEGLVAYVGPMISEGTPSLVASSTLGGERLTVEGSGFSSSAADMEVYYGPDEDRSRYRGIIDELTVTNTSFTFVLVPGVGRNLNITAVVKGIVTLPSASTVSYPPPQLTPGTISLLANKLDPQLEPRSLIGTSAAGDILYASGLHLGPDPSMVGVTLRKNPSGKEYPCMLESADIVLGDTNLSCRVAPGEGADFHMRVRVPADGSSTQQVIGLDSYSYPTSPIVERVSGCTDSGNTTELCPTSATDASGENMRITIYGQRFSGRSIGFQAYVN
jgi:hypothetical protein